VVEQGCTVSDAQIGTNVHLRPGCVIDSSRIRDDACIGPFAHIRNGAEITQGAVIGNFVEVKNSRIGSGSKACHLSYLGDATIGAGVNIGAGTITSNFDGTTKHPTTIADRAFIGSNTTLVAPVAVGEQALIGAGSTITRDVPAGALSIARARQVNRAGRRSAGRSSRKKRTT
jgi:bifunctional UDP-N-acetylglucosamine pyrophosphorylase/glucosamine-1-phosphate N-acetyltransferase